MKNTATKTRIMNIGLLLLALISSVLLWGFVMVENDPEQQRTIRGITPTFVGEEGAFKANDLIRISAAAPMDIVFQGRTSDLYRLSNTNVSVIVDMSAVKTPGERRLTYELRLPETVEGEVIVVKKADYINVTVDRIVKKPVEFRLTGDITAADGYARLQNVLEPQILNVSGPQSVLETIAYAEVEVPNAEPISITKELTLNFRLRDKDNNTVYSEFLETEVQLVDVTFPVQAIKTVPVDIECIDGGGLTRNKNLVVSFEPEEIVVAGDASVLDLFNVCILRTFNLAELIEPVEKDIEIPLPNGMTCLSGETTVRVSIDIVGVTTKKLFVAPHANGYNPPQNAALDWVTRQIEITLRGSPEVLDQMTSANVFAVVDLTGVVLQYDSPQEFPVEVVLEGISGAGVLGKYTAIVEQVEAPE